MIKGLIAIKAFVVRPATGVQIATIGQPTGPLSGVLREETIPEGTAEDNIEQSFDWEMSLHPL